MFLHKTPWLVQNWLFPQYCWKVPTSEKEIFLTFDDGPIPGLTEQILDILYQYRALATFFCVGDNISKHPEIFRRILAEGHGVGNHTYHHLKGWDTPLATYLADFLECQQVAAAHGAELKLFRPPYGKLSRKQSRQVERTHKVVMWDVLSGDYALSVSPEICLQKSIKHSQAGSIIVFHDNYKAAEKVLFTLPLYIEHFRQQGYRFSVVPCQ